MILNVSGNISRYYAESLVLLFFPGSKFPEDSTLDTDRIIVNITAKLTNESAYGQVSITDEKGRVEEASYTVPYEVCLGKSDEMKLKIASGGAMLKAGSQYTGVFPPWGMLTGVRPAKMAAEFMSKGHTDIETQKALCDIFLCKPEKAKLAVMTAQTESVYITDKARRECSVYIAIPFCPTKCTYCSFVSFTSERLLSLIPKYFKALISDIQYKFELIRELGVRVSTVYIGGGTPTVLSTEQLKVLLKAISECVDVSTLDEFTLEAGRPDTITEEKLFIAASFGVTRISVNPQTLNDEILSSIGRKHNTEDFFTAYRLAEKSGVRDINVDLIAGLPGESLSSFQNSLDRICELSPTNVTVHTFYAKRAAELVKKNKEIYRITDLETCKAVDYSQEKLCDNGYLPYYMYRQKNTVANLENVGYAKAGHEGIYNIMMMDEIHSVFGIGASAMTKFVSPQPDKMKIIRICEPKYPYEYLDGHNGEDGHKRRQHLIDEAVKFYSQY